VELAGALCVWQFIGIPVSAVIGFRISAVIGVPVSAVIGVPVSALFRVSVSAVIGVPVSAVIGFPNSVVIGVPVSAVFGFLFRLLSWFPVDEPHAVDLLFVGRSPVRVVLRRRKRIFRGEIHRSPRRVGATIGPGLDGGVHGVRVFAAP